MNQFDLLHTPLAGRNLIEASAGTGKTFTIAGLYLRLVIELQLPVAEILVVTFTEAATKELRERIRERLADAEDAFSRGANSDSFISALMARVPNKAAAKTAITMALRSFDEAAIFTIHGFCQRMLQENPFESGSLYNTELVTDEQAILREIAADYWRIHCYKAPSALVQAALAAGLGPDSLLKLARLQRGNPLVRIVPAAEADIFAEATDKEEDRDKWLLRFKRGFLEYLAEELPGRKRKLNVRFFEDLLFDLHNAVQATDSSLAGLIRNRYRAALIDEFQDTDAIQFKIFDGIYPPGATTPFFLIGDPKQAIYSFRGADIYAYLDAAASPLERHTLAENWRSEPRLIEAVNGLFLSRPAPFCLEEIQFQPVQPADQQREFLTMDGAMDPAPFRLWFAPRREAGKPINKGEAWEMLADAVAVEIAGILQDGANGRLCIGQKPVAPGDIAVLVRANRQARLVQRALRRHAIPSVLCSAGNLFESEEAQDVLHFLSAVADPANERLIKAALVTGLVGVSGDQLALLLENESEWEKVLAEFNQYHDIWGANGAMNMAVRFMADRRLRSRLLALPTGKRTLTNVLHCFETIHDAAVSQRLGMEGVVAWLADRINEDQKQEEHEIRLESDSEAVQLVTIHKSKGLEYAIVFCPFCWAEYGKNEPTVRFHDVDRVTTIDIGSANIEDHRRLAALEGLAENLRLLYVAVTRARHRCYLAWGPFKDAGNSALHYLFHPEAIAAKGQVVLTDEAIIEDLQRLSLAAKKAIAIQQLPQGEARPYLAPAMLTEAYRCRNFAGTIDRDWRVASFTSFTATSHHAPHTVELPDRDSAPKLPGPADNANQELPAGIFAFPRGAAAGIFFHELFEKLDFTNVFMSGPALVENMLKTHGFPSHWQETVLQMAKDVLGASLPGSSGSFKLAEVGLERRLTELEFFFPMALVDSESFRNVAKKWTYLDQHVDMAAMAAQLSFMPVKGMLRGFIDLVFEYGGRYYIADWKSNHLGNQPEDYRPEKLAVEMDRNLYHLQYLIYTVALNSYLQLRLPDYDYGRHFGGVFYIFLRGIHGQSSDRGIFHVIPPREVIDELTTVLVERLP